MTAKDLLDLVQSGGVVGVLVAIVVGALRGWWISGREHAAMVALKDAQILDLTTDRNEWKDMALAGTELAGRAVSVVGTAARRRPR